MRIAMVSEHASPLAALGGPDAGGQNVYVARLSGILAERGHTVTVYTRRESPGQPATVPLAPGVTVVHVPAGEATVLPKDALYPHMPAFGAHLNRLWRTEAPDVVHAHFWMSGMAALTGARDLDIPLVQTFHALGTVKRRHQGSQDTSPPERVGTERRIGRSCARTLATCTDEVRELAAMGVPERRTSVVPCGVDADRFRPCAGQEPAPGRTRRLLAVGRLVPRKGYDLAVRALAGVPGTDLLVAGGPAADLLHAEPEAVRLMRLAAQCGVADRVKLLGGVPHASMPRLIRSVDLVLCTPVYEPFGIVPLEAMACGVPVVATAVGGQQDTVADRVTGRLLPPGTRPGALAATVRELLDSPALLRENGRAGRQRVLAHYTWDRVADGVEQVYRQVAGARTMPEEVA